MEQLGNYIKEKRRLRDLSIRKLAEMAGISHTEVKRLEDGLRKQPSPQVLRAIAAALSVPYEEIMAAAGYIDSQTARKPVGLAAAGLEGEDDLTPEEQAEVYNFIAFIKNKRPK